MDGIAALEARRALESAVYVTVVAPREVLRLRWFLQQLFRVCLQHGKVLRKVSWTIAEVVK